MPLPTRDEVRAQLLAGLREPFLEQLTDWMTHWQDALAHPDAAQQLQAWMLKNPDRAAQAQAIFGRLAGYTEKLEIKTDRYAALDALSDADLEAEVTRRLGLTPEQLRAASAKPVPSLPAPRATPPDPAGLGATMDSSSPAARSPQGVTVEGEWASGGPAT